MNAYPKKKSSLIIFDGLGLSDINPEENAFKKAKTPHFDTLFLDGHLSQLQASGPSVGILEGQMGNSEVGHLTIGSGRITKQSIVTINDSFSQGDFAKIDHFKNALSHAQEFSSHIHILGMFNTPGVHCSLQHLLEIIKIIPSNIQVSFHLFSDGRDSNYKSSLDDLESLESILLGYPHVKISSLSGRFFAMDRDNNWERTQKIYDILYSGTHSTTLSPIEYVKESHKKGCYDEFIEPVLFEGGNTIQKNDCVFFMNFRSDRARQLTQAISGEGFPGTFPLSSVSNIFFVSMTQYYDSYGGKFFIAKNPINNTLADVLANTQHSQLHLAETEKFNHVTKFFNGGKEELVLGQKNILIPSLKVDSYDIAPKMSAGTILDNYLDNTLQYDFTVVNFANADMLGHTGCMSCTVESLEYIDILLGRILDFSHKHGIELILTADHGNCETMGSRNVPHTAHTTNLVPFFYISQGKTVALKPSGGLMDVAPTILDIMNIEQPADMTGRSLLLS